MHCPRCKNMISDDAIVCDNCHTRLKVACPACKELNKIGTKNCTHCGLELIKVCPVCKAANNSGASECRKCQTKFIVHNKHLKTQQSSHSETTINTDSENLNTINKLVNALKDENSTPITESIALNEQNETSQIQTIEQETSLQEISTITAPLNEVDGELADEEQFAQFQYETPETINLYETPIIPDFQEAQKKENESELNKITNSSENSNASQDNDINDEIITSIKHSSENEQSHSTEIFTEEDDIFNLAEDVENETHQENTNEIVLEADNSEDTSSEEYDLDELITEAPSIETQEDNTDETILDISQEGCDDISELDEERPPSQHFFGRQLIKAELIDAVNGSEHFVIGISAPDGNGKSHLLKEIFNETNTHHKIWLWTECTPLTQISPMGAIQDAIINFFSVSVLCNNIDKFEKESRKFFKQNFPQLKRDEVNLLINFLYPHLNSYYENILSNRDRTFNLLEKLLRILKQNGPIVLIIDDFDMMDGSSYDFILRLIANDMLDDNFKIIITYKDSRDVDGFISNSILPEGEFTSLYLNEMNNEEIDTMIREFCGQNNPIPIQIMQQIYENANGNPAYIDGIISYLSEAQALIEQNDKIIFNPDFGNIIIPKTLTEIVEAKLEVLKTTNNAVYKLIILAAIMGTKFSAEVLHFAADLEDVEFENALQILIHFGYFVGRYSSTLSFKNTLIWKECYNIAKNDLNYKEYNQNLYDAIAYNTLTNNSLKALIAQNLDSPEYCFNFWTENIKLAAYIGDISLYVISQKQCLKYLDKISSPQNTLIKNNIYERIGKLLANTAPSQAMEFLSNAILVAQNSGNILKLIDLSTYMGISAQLTGNHLGVIEIVDLVLKHIDKNTNPLGWALIKQKKLNALYTLGNLEELVNTAENDILPILSEYNSKRKKHNLFDNDLIYNGWFNANICLARAYILQGSNKGIELLLSISEYLNQNKLRTKDNLTMINLDLALGYSIQGNIKRSKQILKDTMQSYTGSHINNLMLSKWNFVNVLNQLFLKKYNEVQDELFEVVTFANNVGDDFTKNILKTLLGKVIKEAGNVMKALEIYNDQVTYFAGEKLATGALLSWYLIVESSLITDGPERALEIAEKALDVAKNPKINNYYFMVLYKMQIAEIYTIKGDLDAAKMYIEKALLLTKKYNLNYQRTKLYLMYGKYFEERLLKKPEKQSTIAPLVIKNYKAAMTLAKKLSLEMFYNEAKAATTNFETFCKLNKVKE